MTASAHYTAAAADPGYFGRYYLPHYFTRPSPPFHRRLDHLWQNRVMKTCDPLTDAETILSEKGTRSAIAAPPRPRKKHGDEPEKRAARRPLRL